MWACKICSQSFDTIPTDAIPIGERRQHGYRLWKFSNGSLHDLREVTPSLVGRKGAHTRFHTNRGIKKDECRYCLEDLEAENPHQERSCSQ